VDIKKAKAKDAFRVHRSNAKVRNLGFHFTFEQWVKWWEEQLGPNWLLLRGPKKHQYCMARLNDKGPYVVENVKCITNRKNRKEQSKSGENNGRNKLTKEQVDYIRASKDRNVHLVVRFNVSKGTICNIRRGASWKVQKGESEDAP
jgi:hypothetical protein